MNGRIIHTTIFFVLGLIISQVCYGQKAKQYKDSLFQKCYVYQIKNRHSDTLKIPNLGFYHINLCPHIKYRTINDTLSVTIETDMNLYETARDGHVEIDGYLNITEIKIPSGKTSYFYFPRCTNFDFADLNNWKTIRFLIRNKVYYLSISDMKVYER